MSRVQLALNVADLDASVAFYSTLFGAEPHKRRPGYANFALSEPPLKLVLIEVGAEARGHGTSGALNHLGVEVETTDDVTAATDRLSQGGLATFSENDTTCCYALQDKVWVHDPAGAPWEFYTVKDDNPSDAQPPSATLDLLATDLNDGGCCTTDPTASTAAREPAAACC